MTLAVDPLGTWSVSIILILKDSISRYTDVLSLIKPQLWLTHIYSKDIMTNKAMHQQSSLLFPESTSMLLQKHQSLWDVPRVKLYK